VLLNSALLLAPQDGAIMDSVGWAYFLRGETDKALTFLEQAVELVPDDAVVVDHLGDAYLKHGWTLQAVWQWQRAVVLAEANLGEYGKVKREAEKKIRRFRD
jgi:tetratricopeptide (TPR) repeat protein